MDGEAMPRWIYVTAPDDRSGGGEAKRRPKPMPVDRRNPAMVQAMRREIAGTSGDVSFVEALPQPTDVPSGDDGERTMAELGVEFTVVRAGIRENDGGRDGATKGQARRDVARHGARPPRHAR
jgi:hypothetical protein